MFLHNVFTYSCSVGIFSSFSLCFHPILSPDITYWLGSGKRISLKEFSPSSGGSFPLHPRPGGSVRFHFRLTNSGLTARLGWLAGWLLGKRQKNGIRKETVGQVWHVLETFYGTWRRRGMKRNILAVHLNREIRVVCFIYVNWFFTFFLSFSLFCFIVAVKWSFIAEKFEICVYVYELMEVTFPLTCHWSYCSD